MKKLITIAILAIASLVNAQTSIKYTYDANGNRTQRKYVSELWSARTAQDAPQDSNTEPTPEEKEEALKVIAQEGINLFPNPATDMVNVNFANFISTNKHEVSISDINGRVVLQQNLQIANNQLNVKQLLPGNYIILVNANNKMVYYKLQKLE